MHFYNKNSLIECYGFHKIYIYSSIFLKKKKIFDEEKNTNENQINNNIEFGWKPYGFRVKIRGFFFSLLHIFPIYIHCRHLRNGLPFLRYLLNVEQHCLLNCSIEKIYKNVTALYKEVYVCKFFIYEKFQIGCYKVYNCVKKPFYNVEETSVNRC